MIDFSWNAFIERKIWLIQKNPILAGALIIGAAIYIYLRVSGKINGIQLGKNKNKPNQQQQADYILK